MHLIYWSLLVAGNTERRYGPGLTEPNIRRRTWMVASQWLEEKMDQLAVHPGNNTSLYLVRSEETEKQ